MQVCLGVGEVEIASAAVDHIEIGVTIRSSAHDAAALDATAVEVVRTAQGVAVAQTGVGRAGHWFDRETAEAIAVVRVPPSVTLEFDVRVDVGSATGAGLAGAGNQRWAVDVGDLSLAYASLAGSLRVTSDVGDVVAHLPGGPPYTVGAAAWAPLRLPWPASRWMHTTRTRPAKWFAAAPRATEARRSASRPQQTLAPSASATPERLAPQMLAHSFWIGTRQMVSNSAAGTSSGLLR